MSEFRRSRQQRSHFLPNLAASRVFDLFKELVGNVRARLPMPMVVLWASHSAAGGTADDKVVRDDQVVREIVERVYDVESKRLQLCKLIDLRNTAEDSDRVALDIVRGLSGDWENEGASLYGPLDFPRSDLLAAIEEAVSQASDEVRNQPASGRPEQRVLDILFGWQWRPASVRARDSWLRALARIVGPWAAVVVPLAVAIVSILGTRVSSTVLVDILLVLLFAWPVVSLLLWTYQRSAGWARPRLAGHWFATTTFLAEPERLELTPSIWYPQRSRAIIAARAREVIRIMLAAEAAEPSPERQRARRFHLQLRTLALLEDMRAEFRYSLVSGRRRTVPPMVFLPRVTEKNGGIALLGAISDVRSRRSELDPLLVLAGIRYQDRDQLNSRPLNNDLDTATDLEPSRLYRAWVTKQLRFGQSASRGSILPWVLPVPLAADFLSLPNTVPSDVKPRAQPLIGVPLLRRIAIGGLIAALGVGVFFAWSGYLHVRAMRNAEICSESPGVQPLEPGYRYAKKDGSECVGLLNSTASPNNQRLFVSMTSQHRDPATGQTFDAKAALADLLADINKTNSEIEDNYFTIVYAGPLTTTSTDGADARDAIKELIGVHVAQLSNNRAGNTLKIKVLVANGGQGMFGQVAMTERIVHAAQADRSIVGVVGLGWDVDSSNQVMAMLQKAGLVVVDTQNSGAYLVDGYSNYFGLAATDAEEAETLARIAAKQLTPNTSRNVFLLEGRRPSSVGALNGDRYALEQARWAIPALTGQGFQVVGGQPTIYEDSSSDVGISILIQNGQLCANNDVPVVIYLAGRTNDLTSLTSAWSQHCSRTPVTLLTGDDFTNYLYGGTVHPKVSIPSNMSIYYTVLADPARTAKNSLLGGEVKAYLFNGPGIDEKELGYGSQLFADGSLALAYDATNAIKNGEAGRQPALRGADLIHALNKVTFHGATGDIDFTKLARPDLSGRHALELRRILPDDNLGQGICTIIDQSTGSPKGRCNP